MKAVVWLVPVGTALPEGKRKIKGDRVHVMQVGSLIGHTPQDCSHQLLMIFLTPLMLFTMVGDMGCFAQAQLPLVPAYGPRRLTCLMTKFL